MAQCQLHIQQPMPPLCLCCGKQASHLSRQTFVSTNPWTLWTVPLGTWYYNKIVLQIPLCDAHRNSIRYRWVGPFTFLVLSGLAIFVSWAIYSSINGREASDAVSGWVGGAVAIVFALFYIALLYASFTRPHVSRVQGDVITLSKVSDAFAGGLHGNPAFTTFAGSSAQPVLLAELVDDPPGKLVSPFIPTAQLAESPIRKPKKRFSWGWFLAGSIALLCIFVCGGVFGLLLGINGSRPVSITAAIDRPDENVIAPAQLRVTYRAVGELDDRHSYIWVIRHGNQRFPPRSISAAEMRQGGVIELFLFDHHATSAEIWIETDNPDGSAPEIVSNVVRVRVRKSPLL